MVDFYLKKVDVLLCTTIIESGLDVPVGQYHHHRPRRHPGLGPALPAAGAGRPGQVPGLRLFAGPGGRGDERGGAEAAAGHRRADGAGLRIQDRGAGPGDPRSGEPPGGRTVGSHRRRGLRPVHPAHPGDRPRTEGGAHRGRSRADHSPARRGIHSRILRPGSRAAPQPVQAAGRAARDATAGRFRRRAGGPLRARSRPRRGGCSR